MPAIAISQKSKSDSAISQSSDGQFLRSSGSSSLPVYSSILTSDVSGLDISLSGKVDISTDQNVGGKKTFSSDTIKPNNKPIHFETLNIPNSSGVRFTYCTNAGGHPFEDNQGNIRRDNIIQWGWNPGTDYNDAWNPAYPSIYDTMEEAYLTPAGDILGEYNYEGVHSSWRGARRWRSRAANHLTGHGSALMCSDYTEWRDNQGQHTKFQIGVSTNNGFGPFGVYEVELTGAFSTYNGMGTGYTDGTGYDLIFTGGGGQGAAGKFDVVDGAVKNVSLSSTGYGYDSAPSVSFSNGGPGTGAEAQVLIGSISATIPINARNIVSGTQFWLSNTATSNNYHLIGAANSSGSIYAGVNIVDSSGTYKRVIDGASSAISYSSSGGIDFIVDGSQVAGTSLSTTMRLTSSGGLTLFPATSTTYFALTLPPVQSDNIIYIVKNATLGSIFQVTKDGYIGNNAGSGVTAPIDVTRLDTGNMAQFGANGVKSLLTFSYNATITITSSPFGPLEIKSQANNDISIIPNGTGKIGLGLSATKFKKILSSSAILDFGSTAAQSSSDLTMSLTGAVVGDPVSLGIPASPNPNSSFTAWVSSADTITVRFNNYSSAAIDPVSGTFRAAIIQF